jgi:hypothetical protein
MRNVDGGTHARAMEEQETGGALRAADDDEEQERGRLRWSAARRAQKRQARGSSRG